MDASQELPRLLAIDLGGDIGLILFTRYQNCAYQHLINGDQRSGQKIILWMREIVDKQEKTLFMSDYRDVDVNWNTWETNSCIPKLIEGDRVLFEKTFKGSDTFPISKGWHDVKNGENDVTLDIIPLEFCVIYQSLHVQVDKKDVAQITNFNECRMPPKRPHPNTRYFVSANFGQEPFSCQYGLVDNMKNPIVTLTQPMGDRNASTLFFEKECDGTYTEVNALDLSHGGSGAGDDATQGFSTEIDNGTWITAVGASLGGLLLIVIGITVIIHLKNKDKFCCKNAEDDEEVDVNEEYGDQQYYDYMETHHPTNVVDDNEIYAAAEYED